MVSTPCRQNADIEPTCHFDFLPLLPGLCLYLSEAIDAWASANEGALSPINAYNSREMPSGFLIAVESFLGFGAPLADCFGSARMDRTSLELMTGLTLGVRQCFLAGVR